MKDVIISIYYKIVNFIEAFIFPAYSLRRMLFHRLDVLKFPQLRPWEYCDPRQIIVYANMQALNRFWEEDPEKYVCWKLDDDGNDVGPKVKSDLFPEINGMYVIDVAHLIQDEFDVNIPNFKKELDVVYSALSMVSPKMKWMTEDGRLVDLFSIEDVKLKAVHDFSGIPEKPDEEFFKEKGMSDEEIEILHKYFGKSLKRAKINNRKMFHKINDLEKEYEDRVNKAIHYLAEIRVYLWI